MDIPLSINEYCNECNHRSKYRGLCRAPTAGFVWCLTDDEQIFRVASCEEHREDMLNKPYYFELRAEAVATLVTGKLT